MPNVYEKRIAIRWRDLDAYAHVNQAVYQTYLEEIFDGWFRTCSAGFWDYVAARVVDRLPAELTLETARSSAPSGSSGSGRRASPCAARSTPPTGASPPRPSSSSSPATPETGESRPLTDAERAAFEAAA